MKKAFITGHLTRDVELRIVGKEDTKKTVATLNVAANEIGDKEATFFDIEVWNKTAEACAQYLAKGSAVSIVAEISANNYEKDGKKYYGYKYVADDVEFLSGGKKQKQDQ